jgi:hypothetical protein
MLTVGESRTVAVHLELTRTPGAWPTFGTARAIVQGDAPSLSLAHRLPHHDARFTGVCRQAEGEFGWIGMPIHIGMRIRSYSAHVITGEVRWVQSGHPHLSDVPTALHVSVELTPTQWVAQDTTEYRVADGGAFIWPVEVTSEPPSIPTSLGPCTLRRQLRSRRIAVDHEHGVLLVERPTACLTVTGTDCASDIAAVARRAFAVIDDEIGPVLTLLDRRPVRATTIHVLAMTADGPMRDGVFTAVRETYLASAGAVDPVARPASLPRDGLAVLTERLARSPHAALVRRVIPYLAGFWSSEYIETRAVVAWMALESLVQVLATELPPTVPVHSEQVDRLRTELTRVLDACAVDHGLDDGLVRTFRARISDLTPRRSFPAQATAVLLQWRVRWDDLWPAFPRDAAGLESALRASYRLRSRLVHAAVGADGLLLDAARIHHLAERLLLRLLDFDDEWLWAFASHYTQGTLEPADDLPPASADEG